MEFNDNKPIYLQIAEQMMDEVERPGFIPESRIPSVRELAADSGVNPNTVLRAYNWLQQEKIIENRRGVGYFFSSYAQERVHYRRCREFFDKELPEFVKRMIILGIHPGHFDDLYKKMLQEHLSGKF